MNPKTIFSATLSASLGIALALPVIAGQNDTQGMNMPAMPIPGRKPATRQTTQPQHGKHAAAPAPATSAQSGSEANGADMPSMQGGSAPADARSPDYSDGYAYGPMASLDMHDNPAMGMLLLDRLEYAHSRDGGNTVAIDGQARYGRNFNKLWLKFEGDRAGGRLQDLRTEALWGHAVATYWDTQLGVRHDFGGGPSRTWAAFGVEGLAPYWFETEATLYIGQDGRTAARVQVEYEARLTQRWVLQPEFEANFYGKDDPQRGTGSGLSDAEAGLRLRYEIHREFAPYVGVVWHQQFGRTRSYARTRGDPGNDLQFVAGFRIWF